MVTCEKVQIYPYGPFLRRDGCAYIQLLTDAICESLGDSIQRGRGRGGGGYLGK